MDSSLFKKITYGIVLISLFGVIYLAFFKDDSTSKNADFLGIKNSSENNDISNQQELNIDGSNEDKKSDENNESSDSEDTKVNKTGFYTVKEGDTYGCIAEIYYGSFEHWTDILNANIRYGNGYSEHELHVGAVLEMPEISKDILKPASKLCS